MKHFEYTLYSRNGTYKKTINPKHISGDVEYTEEINGGQGSLSLSVVGEATTYTIWDIIEIRELEDGDGSIRPAYTGIIESLTLTEYAHFDQIDIELLAVNTILTHTLYKNTWGARKFSESGKISELAKKIIEHASTTYGAMSGNTENLSDTILFFTPESIPDTAETTTLEVDNTNHNDALSKILENTDFYFFVDAVGCVWLKKENTTPIINLTMGREVVSYTQKIKSENLANTLYFTRKDDIEKTYTNTESITTYGIRETAEKNDAITSETLQDEKGRIFLEKNSTPNTEIVLIVRPQPCNFLYPWYRLNLMNVRNTSAEKKITKIQKWIEVWSVTVGNFASFGQILSKK